jgi:hypothetical protein
MKYEDLKGNVGRKLLIEGMFDDDPYDGGYNVYVQFDPGCPDKYSRCQVPISAIREILPADIKVGDRVWTQCDSNAAVVGVVDDSGPVVVVRFDDGDHSVGRPSDFRLIEPAQ